MRVDAGGVAAHVDGLTRGGLAREANLAGDGTGGRRVNLVVGDGRLGGGCCGLHAGGFGASEREDEGDGCELGTLENANIFISA